MGDSSDMVRARSAFLEAGHLAPVAAAVAQAAARTAARTASPGALAEIGCGTGHYLRATYDHLASSGRPPDGAYGFDLSKAAAAHASRRNRDLQFAVADVESQIPLLDAAATVLLSVFAPRPAAECARVLAPGGALVAAFATPRHLHGLRSRWGLLEVGPDKLARLSERLAGPFGPPVGHTIEYEIELAPADAERLVSMGPNARHGGVPGPIAEATREQVSVTVARFERT